MESIEYLQDRYAAPHIERVAVENKKMTREETVAIVEKLKSQGLISIKPKVHEFLTPEQKADARRRLAAGEGPSDIAYDMFVDRHLIRNLQYKPRTK